MGALPEKLGPSLDVPWGTNYNGLYVDAPPERGTFFWSVFGNKEPRYKIEEPDPNRRI